MKESFLQRVGSWSKTMWGRVLAAFRREQSRETFTFLGFVLLALVFWFLQGLNDEVEGRFVVPVELQNLPEKTMLIEDLPASIEVQVRDKGPAMLGYLIKGVSPLRVDFQDYAQGRNPVVLLPAQLRTLLQESLRPSTQILSMSLDTLRVAYTHNPGKRVKVVVKSSISTSPQSVLSGEVKSETDSVLVYGEYKELNKIQEVYTEEIHEAELVDTLRREVEIAPIPRVRIIPNRVMVTIPVEEMVSKTLDVPISPQNLSADWHLTMLPSTVQLTCMMPFSKFTEVDASSFLLGVDLRAQHNGKLEVQVIDSPAFVRNITLSQDSIDFILIELREGATAKKKE